MAKVKQVKFRDKILEGIMMIHCPGCKHGHGIDTIYPNHLGAKWNFNQDMDNPTFTPSVNIKWESDGKIERCHFFITNGMIQYCTDSTHSLSGQTVELPHIDP